MIGNNSHMTVTGDWRPGNGAGNGQEMRGQGTRGTGNRGDRE